MENFEDLSQSNLEQKEKKSEQKIETETEELVIQAPESTYFVHGVKAWSKEDKIGIRNLEVSASLQKDNFTKPIRPYGYILKIDKGAISIAFDRDVSSEYNENGKKELKTQSAGRKRRKYTEDELQDLIANTKAGSHNEVWTRGDGIEIIGGYITEDALSAAGAKSFLKSCQRNSIPVRIIKEESGSQLE